MSKHKYMVFFRSGPVSGGGGRPSPEQMQQMFAAYQAWMAKFKDQIVDVGDKLKAGGKVVTAAGVAEGPYVEVKELIGGYMIVSADDYDGAVAVVQACPAVNAPGAIMEIRELMGAKM